MTDAKLQQAIGLQGQIKNLQVQIANLGLATDYGVSVTTNITKAQQDMKTILAVIGAIVLLSGCAETQEHFDRRKTQAYTESDAR